MREMVAGGTSQRSARTAECIMAVRSKVQPVARPEPPTRSELDLTAQLPVQRLLKLKQFNQSQSHTID